MSEKSKGFVPYAGEDLARLRIHVTTMGDLLLEAADRYPDTLALVLPDQEITYAELARRGVWVEGCAEGLGFDTLRPTLAAPILAIMLTPPERPGRKGAGRATRQIIKLSGK